MSFFENINHFFIILTACSVGEKIKNFDIHFQSCFLKLRFHRGLPTYSFPLALATGLSKMQKLFYSIFISLTLKAIIFHNCDRSLVRILITSSIFSSISSWHLSHYWCQSSSAPFPSSEHRIVAGNGGR